MSVASQQTLYGADAAPGVSAAAVEQGAAPQAAGSVGARRLPRLIALLLGPLSQERRELKRARAAADREILRLPWPPVRLAWRSAELVSGRHRLYLAGELARLLELASPRYLPSASPLRRGELRASELQIESLCRRLRDLEIPVAPRGMARLEHLLVDVDGPLYLDGEVDLREALLQVADELELHASAYGQGARERREAGL